MRLTAYGVPRPQGSKTAFPIRRANGSTGVAITEGTKSASLKDWRNLIRHVWNNGRPPATLTGPVCISLTFYLPKPKSAAKSRIYPTTKPDWDKLARAACDALTKLAYEDDSRIVEAHVYKHYAIGRQPGVEIEITEKIAP